MILPSNGLRGGALPKRLLLTGPPGAAIRGGRALIVGCRGGSLLKKVFTQKKLQVF